MINRKGINANNPSTAPSSLNKKNSNNNRIGRVKDIILNENFPNIEQYGGVNAIGSVFYEDAEVIGNSLGLAKPLNPNIQSYPLINELVIIHKLPSQNIGENNTDKVSYYSQIINIWNHPHHNAYPSTLDFLNQGSANLNESYKDNEAGVIKTSENNFEDISLDSPSNPTQPKFIEKSNIQPLLPFPGDNIIQGRFGNSIRFGSTSFNDRDLLNNWSDDGENGNPITIIRNGQPDGENEGWKHITEDINNDKSSIYLTSNQKINIKLPSNKFNSFRQLPTLPSQYKDSQILICSNQITISSKKDNIFINSNKSISLSSNENVNIDSKQTVVSSSDIKLGGENAEERLVKGDTLLKNLNFMLDSLSLLVSAMEVQQLWPGGLPTPDGVTMMTANTLKNNIKLVKKDLTNILSKTTKVI
jgi:hypothetical protein